ncbi:MAG: hypothetical protein ACI4PQ_07405, partial [Butyricicoccaceae bacterium]
MKKILFFLIGLVCDAYAMVYCQRITFYYPDIKNAVLLCVLLYAALILFNNATTENTIPRYLLQGANCLYYFNIIMIIYREFCPPVTEQLTAFCLWLDPSDLTIFFPGVLTTVLLLVLLFIFAVALEEIRRGCMNVVFSVIALYILCITTMAMIQTRLMYNGTAWRLADTIVLAVLFVAIYWCSNRCHSIPLIIEQAMFGLILVAFGFIVLGQAFDLINDLELYLIQFLLLLTLSVIGFGLGGTNLRSAFRSIRFQIRNRPKAAPKRAAPRRTPEPKKQRRRRRPQAQPAGGAKTAHDPGATIGEDFPIA